MNTSSLTGITPATYEAEDSRARICIRPHIALRCALCIPCWQSLVVPTREITGITIDCQLPIASRTHHLSNSW